MNQDVWRERLPTLSDRRLAVRATHDAVRHLRGGNPWLYDGSIESVSHEGSPGDLAVVFDERRRFVAIGLWDPGSPIRVRVLHHGAPETIDDAWFRTRIHRSLERRSALAADGGTTAYRCIHGENDGLPALVADRYADTMVVKLYSAAWLPYLPQIVDALVDLSGVTRVVLRLARVVAGGETFGLSDGDTLVGSPPSAPIEFRERGLAMEADVVHGQKTGHFLDQRDNRILVRGMSEGLDVLDLFASSGGFSLAAAVGGAKSVHLVDLSVPALAAAERNIELNRNLPAVRRCAVRTTAGDVFKVAARSALAGEQYDLVIIDPPSFAQNQAGVDRALRAYGRLTRAGIALLRPGGVLVQASCSSRVTADDFFACVGDAAGRTGRRLHEIRRTGHPVDHPIGFEYGGYLKALFARVD